MALLLILLLAAPPAADPFPDLPPGDASALEARGDAKLLAGEGHAAVSLWRWSFLRSMPELSQRAFRQPVDVRFLTREQTQALVKQLWREEQSVAEVLADSLAYAAFDFWPADFSLQSTLDQMYGEEVAGLYDPDRKALYVVADPKALKPPGVVERVLGVKPGDEIKTVLVHEMQHALDDQHFDLHSMSKSLRRDDDSMWAFSGLVEGSATLVMILAVVEPRDREAFVMAPPGLLAAFMGPMLKLSAAFASGAAYRNAPKLLQTQLLSPYLDGMRFAHHLVHNGGWKALDAAFVDPPTSTEQLLHPEKYEQRRRDPPLEVQLPPDAPVAPGWVHVKQNTLGEAAIGILLRNASAAEGWDGDTYRVYRRGEMLLLLWETVWETAAEASRFAAAARARLPDAKVQLAGPRVALVRGPIGIPETVRLFGWLHGARVVPKRRPIRKHRAKVELPKQPDPRLAHPRRGR